ncbi:protein-L-isoaspartate O-methyltransferase family protein [Rehaibacterium terrae]|jgi:protein-L-isoaspartate(D-aspartate) O-methyltransferase|uniref:Protein-L-isoaspartate O-methyltransferase n=1 Tax=Rehaibacterium terrae TaxID=1341696 RepID=A0A7W8DCX5_9GAMM|nr:protein-L-isoaspartate O-methyltransferase [Rehaibacterium terrae]MBB5014823.1 protein-L-isoaspartate(D-aspartate) O-methyltransferase [Rehaibacterium terrae]
MAIDFEQARHAMIEQQVRPWEVLDPRVLETLSVVKREDYVPPRYRKLAFADLALPLEHGEFMMKPVVEGRMLQALDLAPEDDVLEIGTGSGFITACLARLARAVTSIDIHADFVERARQRLLADGITNVRLETADALAYDPSHQFDAVCVTGAVAEIPPRFLEWVRPEGRLFVVRGHSPVQEAVRLVRHGERWAEESLFETDLPYLQGAAPVKRFTL